MKVKLMGYSQFQSKEGKQCCIVGMMVRDQYWNGFKPLEKFVNPLNIGCELKPGEEYNVEFDQNGRLLSIEPIAQ